MFKLMVKAKDTSTLFKSYGLLHKVDILFNLYKIYTSEYKFHVKKYLSLFKQNKIIIFRRANICIFLYT